jgi:transitional endoplasmic reticulum ATPase
MPPPDPRIARGEGAFEDGRYDEAVALLTEAFDADPTSARVSCFLGLAWWRKGDADQAIHHLTRACELAKRQTIVSHDPSVELRVLARAHHQKKAHQEALLWVERGITREPEDAYLHDLAGDIHYARKDYAKAAASYGSALGFGRAQQTWPDTEGTLLRKRATALHMAKRDQEALAAIDEAIRLEPARGSFHNRRGLILGHGLKDIEGAMAAIRKAIDLDPEYKDGGRGGYHYNLAGYLSEQERHEEALAFANAALSLDPDDADYRTRQRRLSEKVQRAPGARAGLRTFADIGGMKELKEEIRRAVNVIHLARDKAREYRIERNGILLYGPPGCGKTSIAEAIAGEFQLRFIHVATGAMLSKWIGEGAKQVSKAFEEAVLQLPCVLFFDECEALLGQREDRKDPGTVDAFCHAVDKYRGVPGLVMVAATNNLEALDKAAVREGRFDYKIKIYKPDFEARLEMLKVKLQGRPTGADLDCFALADGTEGFSAARVSGMVNQAAMAALEENVPISQRHLASALAAEMGKDRFEGKRLAWSDLIVSPQTMQKLRFTADALLHPEKAAALGIEPPTGLLLYGPPGTGKTTIARVLASELEASFYAISPADIYSRWAGESEQRVKETFEKARDNRPSIVFIDEIDALLSRRTDGDSGGAAFRNSIINLFLMEMDGLSSLPGVFVLGATNRRDLLDEALLRPGRLSEQIEVLPPSEQERARLFRLFTRKMTLDGDVDLGLLAAETTGFSGAEIESVCGNAGRNALVRVLESSEAPTVKRRDFEAALAERRTARGGPPPTRPMGFAR